MHESDSNSWKGRDEEENKLETKMTKKANHGAHQVWGVPYQSTGHLTITMGAFASSNTRSTLDKAPTLLILRDCPIADIKQHLTPWRWMER